jgi:hypothetical protein
MFAYSGKSMFSIKSKICKAFHFFKLSLKMKRIIILIIFLAIGLSSFSQEINFLKELNPLYLSI